MMTTTASQRFHHWVKGVTLGLLVISSWVSVEAVQGQPAQREFPEIIIHRASNSGSAWITISNNTGKLGSLRASDFRSKVTGRKLGAKVTFSESEGTQGKESLPLQPGTTLNLKVEASNVWEAGESEATLFIGDTSIGQLKAVKYDVPFAVKLDAANPDLPDISFERGKSAILFLRNDDAMTYPVRWKLIIGSKDLDWSNVTLPPNGAAQIQINPPGEWFTQWFSGLLKEEVRDGKLMVRFSPPGDPDNPSLPMKPITIKAQLSYWSQGTRQFWSTFFILLLLAAGGICSLILSYWVPNRLQRIDLLERLRALADKTRDLSRRIDSSLRVLVRVERYRLEKMLRSRWSFSPQLASVFKQCGEGITKLDRKIDLLEQIDTAYDNLAHHHSSDRPPTLTEQIEELLHMASDQLRRIDLEDSHFQAAQTLITDARARVDKLGQKDEAFAQTLATRVQGLRADFAPGGSVGSSGVCKQISDLLPSPFEVIKTDKFEDAAKCLPDQYRWIDMNTSKLELIRDYIRLWEGSTQDARREELKQHREWFLAVLSLESRDALREARLLVQQMNEGIYQSHLLEAIQSDQQAVSIEIDPGRPRVNQPVQLSLWFHREDYNQSAARHEFVCEWDFGHDDLKERGETVSHFFPQAREYLVQVNCHHAAGQPIMSGQGKPLSISKSVEKSMKIKSEEQGWFGERTRVELIRLSIALVAALLGLVAGAREQLLKLDVAAGLIAVFLLGFGADTIKNLLTQRQQ